jgi:hypothetical protein
MYEMEALQEEYDKVSKENAGQTLTHEEFKLWQLKLDAIIKQMVLKESGGPKICVHCKSEFIGFGNDAEPILKGVVCDTCNTFFVVPSRFAKMFSHS